MKSYIAHVSSRRLFRALNIESNLARPVNIQIPTQSPERYTAELPIEAHQGFFIPSKFALCAKYSHIVYFLRSRWMETAPTSIEVLLRPTLGQSDEPSDLRGSLSPTSVYSTWQSPGGHPSNYEPGATLLNFSDRANHDERTPYSVYRSVTHTIVCIILSPMETYMAQSLINTGGGGAGRCQHIGFFSSSALPFNLGLMWFCYIMQTGMDPN